MPRKRREDEYIPIKCEGWNGKFETQKHEEGMITQREAYKKQQMQSDSRRFFGINTEPTVLPPTWDGTFSKAEPEPGEVRYKPEPNRSDSSQYFATNTEPTVLPTTWSGKFELDPNDVRIKPERNTSDVRNYV